MGLGIENLMLEERLDVVLVPDVVVVDDDVHDRGSDAARRLVLEGSVTTGLVEIAVEVLAVENPVLKVDGKRPEELLIDEILEVERLLLVARDVRELRPQVEAVLELGLETMDGLLTTKVKQNLSWKQTQMYLSCLLKRWKRYR